MVLISRRRGQTQSSAGGSAFRDKAFAHEHPTCIVDVQNLDAHFAGFGPASQDGAVPVEMAVPRLSTRIE
jgi:hypothetical protein